MASTSYDSPPWAGKSGIGLHQDVLKVTARYTSNCRFVDVICNIKIFYIGTEKINCFVAIFKKLHFT